MQNTKMQHCYAYKSILVIIITYEQLLQQWKESIIACIYI